MTRFQKRQGLTESHFSLFLWLVWGEWHFLNHLRLSQSKRAKITIRLNGNV